MKFKKLLSLSLAAVMVGVFAFSSSSALQYEKNYGRDRIKTSEYVANSLNPHKNATDVYPLPNGQSVPTVIVNGWSFQDGLSAYNLVEKFGARLLMIRQDGDYANMGLIDKFYHSKEVYLLGSTKEISAGVEKGFKRFYPKMKIIRVPGNNVYERNLATLKMTGFKNVGVADGRNFPDALSAAGMLHTRGCGLMLVDGSKDYKVPAGLNVKYTIGGQSSVAVTKGQRLAGQNRYKTAIEVAKAAGNYKDTIIVDGRKYPDSISAINFIRPYNAIVLPISPDRDNSDMHQFCIKRPMMHFVGGEASIPGTLVRDFFVPCERASWR